MKRLMMTIAGALSAFALFASTTGVTVNGVDVGTGSGTGWTYDPTTKYVEVAEAGDYVLSGTNTAGEVMFAINANAEVTLSNLCLKCTTEGECCICATNNTTVTLFLAGTNTLDASGATDVSDMGEGLCIENGTRLKVANAPGFADADAVLVAKGSQNRAAIAVGRHGTEGEKPYFKIAGGTVYANWFDAPAEYSAGIGTSYKTGRNGEADIVISGGRVFAKGGKYAPGIGAAAYESDIRITGGYVEAVGGDQAAGIGGFFEGKYGSATVSGGTVRATGGDRAYDMLAGYQDKGGDGFTVTGGSIYLAHGRVDPAPTNALGKTVYCVTVQDLDSKGKPVKIEELEGYGADDIYEHHGRIFLWLPDGVHTFKVNGQYFRAEVSGGSVTARRHLGHDTGVTVDGKDVACLSGAGWTYDPRTKYVEVMGANRSYVLSGTNTEGEVMFAIDANANVTLSNLCLKCTTQNECCIWATNDVNVTLFLAGTNTLDASVNGEGLCIENDTRLTVTNAPGFADADAVLIAKGSYSRAAIACGRNGAEGPKPYFEIAGGTVYANWFGSPAEYSAGIGASYKTGKNGEADIVISGGRVFAKGGACNPGIGAADFENAGAPDIRIIGGYVEAVGGYGAAGIGGGSQGEYGSATISGGTVRATGGTDASDMLAGKEAQGGGGFTVTGGSIWLARGSASPAPTNALGKTVYCVSVAVEGLKVEELKVEGLEGYGVKDIFAVDGKICLWLPNGTHGFKVDGVDYMAVVNGANTTAQLGKLTGVTVNGIEVGFGSGAGWTYDPKTKYVGVTEAGDYVLSGTNTAGEVMFAIDANAEVTLSNLCLKCTTEDECCICATNDVSVSLFLAGTNTLDASANGEGLCIENDTRLTINNAPGFADGDAVLIAKGGPTCAAIAVGPNGSDGKDISFEIAGGYVEAVGGYHAAAIGGGTGEKYGSATVSGGTVRATGGEDASDMLAGKEAQGGGGFTVTGGSIWLAHESANPAPTNALGKTVWCVTVPGVATDRPMIEGLQGYGTKDIFAVDGKIFLWLPNGEYDFTVGGKRYKATVDNANTVAVEQSAAPLTPGHSSLPYNSEAEAWAAVNGGLISFGQTDEVKAVLDASSILTVEGYKAMFTPVVYQTKEDGKWRVMYELTSDGTNTLMQSIHAVVTNLDVQAIAAAPEEGVLLTPAGGVPGFYYTLFKSGDVTTVKGPSSHDSANTDKLCDAAGTVTFLNVTKPSDAAGFFTISVSPEQVFNGGELGEGDDVRGGGIIVRPPVEN